MGYHIENALSPHHAPTWCFNHCGSLPWGGAHENELSAVSMCAILDFCVSEGFRSGFVDARNQETSSDDSCAFSEVFMGGMARAIWIRNYLAGGADYRARETGRTFNGILSAIPQQVGYSGGPDQPSVEQLAFQWAQMDPKPVVRFWRDKIMKALGHDGWRTRRQKKALCNQALRSGHLAILYACGISECWESRRSLVA